MQVGLIHRRRSREGLGVGTTEKFGCRGILWLGPHENFIEIIIFKIDTKAAL